MENQKGNIISALEVLDALKLSISKTNNNQRDQTITMGKDDEDTYKSTSSNYMKTQESTKNLHSQRETPMNKIYQNQIPINIKSSKSLR